MRRFLSVLLPLSILLYVITGPQVNGQANVKVKGLGHFGNLEMSRRLAFLNGQSESEEVPLNLVLIEDTAYIILRQISRKGHPQPVVTGKVSSVDGTVQSFTWTLPFEGQNPDDAETLTPIAVEFICKPGGLNVYNSINVEGVGAMDSKEVEGFFLPSGTLFTRKKDLAFTEANLATRTGALLGTLHNMGYKQATLTERDFTIDPESGAVDVHLVVEMGSVYKVGEVITEWKMEKVPVEETATDKYAGQIYNAGWLRERRQALLHACYQEGYPNAQVKTEEVEQPSTDPKVSTINIRFRVEKGPHVFFGGVRFQPQGILKESILRRQLNLHEGDPYNLLLVEEGRRNLMSLGVMNSVELDHEEPSPSSWLAQYTLNPLPRKTLKLRLGWGSYERARAGLHWEHLNLFQRAHRYTFDARLSTKSSNVELSYIVPQFFDKRITGYTRAGREYREEITYDRTTTTLLFGATRRFTKPDIEVTTEYSLETQETNRKSEPAFSSTDQATVSSLQLRAVLDKRDNVLYPISGYDFSVISKTASQILGGNANFQKFELSSSFHKYLGSALYLHLSLRYGAIFSRSPSADHLPFNERFFSGGENTIRGYRQGEASPVDAAGNLIGAESFALANVELEQRVFRNLALIVFWDGLAQNVALKTLPDGESLDSVGFGLRLRTPVGPIRLEYGHNLHPRPSDPDGTFHIAVGYPF